MNRALGSEWREPSCASLAVRSRVVTNRFIESGTAAAAAAAAAAPCWCCVQREGPAMCCRGLRSFLASVAAAVTSSVVLLLQWVGCECVENLQCHRTCVSLRCCVFRPVVQRPIVLLLGLDNAGKTTFRMLSADGVPSARPAIIHRPHREGSFLASNSVCTLYLSLSFVH